MPNDERSFRDRESNAVSLKNACNGFTPTFAPADVSLNVANFTTFIGTITTANDAVETFEINYTTSAGTRMARLKTIKETLTQALGYLESNKLWKPNAATARKIVEKVRGTRAPKPVVPPVGETPAQEQKRNQGNQAFVELASHLRKFIGVCTDAAGYSPSASEISLGTMNGLLSEFNGLNGFLSDLEQKISTAQKKRLRLYDETDEGLANKFQAIKKAVKGQYGFSSDEYATVKIIKW